MSNNFDILEALWLRREKKRRAQKIIEGAPPLTYTAKNAGTLKNYRIYGNTVDGESVGDLVTEGDHAGEYCVPVTVNGVTNNLYFPEPIRKVGDNAEYIDYAEQKQHRVRKNLWPGIVEQGSVSSTGTYSDNTKRIRSRNVPIEPGTYTISSNLLIRMIYAYNDNKRIGTCIDTPLGVDLQSFTVPAGANNISIGMMKIVDDVEVDITPSDFIRGQIEKGSEATTYEPYIENTDLDVTLPALPTLTGTNVLSVGTQVQPSKVMVKGKLKE